MSAGDPDTFGCGQVSVFSSPDLSTVVSNAFFTSEQPAASPASVTDLVRHLTGLTSELALPLIVNVAPSILLQVVEDVRPVISSCGTRW
jgi:hypothetical protein